MLWASALAPAWPLLPRAVARLSAGYLAVDAVDDAAVIGLVAVDLAGSVPLLMVAPDRQRQGIGTALLDAAVADLRAAGVEEIDIGSGGGHYIWPGVPLDLPGAVAFFTAHGWHSDYDCLDLVRDLRDYQPPDGIGDRAALAGITLATTVADRAALERFERTHFPQWARWFDGSAGDILIAYDRSGAIVGTLLYEFPDAGTYQPILGPHTATIACVGVSPDRNDQGIGSAMVAHGSELLRDAGAQVCHIGWAVRASFYQRTGYRPWRRYRMFRSPACSAP